MDFQDYSSSWWSPEDMRDPLINGIVFVDGRLLKLVLHA